MKAEGQLLETRGQGGWSMTSWSRGEVPETRSKRENIGVGILCSVLRFERKDMLPCEKTLCLEKELKEEAGPGSPFGKLGILQITANPPWAGGSGRNREECVDF